MRVESVRTGPVKAWIEPDRLTFVRAFPGQSIWFFGFMVVAVLLAVRVHPLFWVLFSVLVFRQATMAAHLRALFRDGRLHPARLLPGTQRLLATLVRLESEAGAQDAVVISRAPRRWRGKPPPWGGERAAVIVAGEPPALRPLSPDFAASDPERGLRAVQRIPENQWEALSRALGQVPLGDPEEGLHPVDLGELPWYGAVSDIEPTGSLPERLTRDQFSQWCAGLPCIEADCLAPAERTRLRRMRKYALLRLALTFGSAVVAWGVIGLAVPERAPIAAMYQVAGMVLVLGTPFLLWVALRSVLTFRALGRDLSQGKLLRFGGKLSSFDSLLGDRDLALLVRRKLLLSEPGVEQEMVVLPNSSLLLYANGRWASPWGLPLHVASVAEAPERPVKLDLPSELAAQGDRPLTVQRRRLLDGEIEEIKRHASTLRRPGRTGFVALLLLALSMTGWDTESLRGASAHPGLSLALLLVGVFAFSTFRRFKLARRLAEDAELGWVLTVDHSEDSGAGTDWDLPAQGVETLMHARVDWTVNLRPAAWRRHRGGLAREG